MGARQAHQRPAFLFGEPVSPRHLLLENPVPQPQVLVLESELLAQQPGHARDSRQAGPVQSSFDGILHPRCL
jgi:hypothetical protein